MFSPGRNVLKKAYETRIRRTCLSRKRVKFDLVNYRVTKKKKIELVQNSFAVNLMLVFAKIVLFTGLSGGPKYRKEGSAIEAKVCGRRRVK